jgi:hypothetical protein
MTTWAQVQAHFEEVWKADGAKREGDLKKHKYTPEHRKHMEEWVRHLKAARKTYDSKEPKTLDVDHEAAWASLQHTPEKTIAWWMEKMGGAFVIRAWCRMWAIDWYGIFYANFVSDHDPHPEFPVARTGFDAWNALRAIVAKDAAARKEAETIRKRAPLSLRVALDFAFPDEHAWADDDVDAHLDGKEACFDYGYKQGEYGAALLASGASREKRDAIAAQLAKWGGRACGWGASSFVPIALALHGEDAVPQVAVLMSQRSNDKKKEFAAEIAKIPRSNVVARTLAAGLEDKTMRSVAQEYLAANPEIARPVLEELIAKKGKVAEAASHVLARIAPGKTAPSGPAATTESLPSVLAKPPWESAKKKTKLPAVPGLKELPYKESIQWNKDERAKHEKPGLELRWLVNWGYIPKSAKPRTKDLDAHILKRLDRAGDGTEFFNQLHYASTFLHAMTDASALAAWTKYPSRAWGLYPDDVLYILARFDTQAIPGWLKCADAVPQKVIESAEHIDSPRIAPFVADTFRYTKRAAITARKWLVSHAEPAAIALIPLALQADEKKRASHAAPAARAACAALRAMPAQTVRAVAKKYGEDARSAVDAILAFDPLDDYPDKLPKLPDFVHASHLPAPVLRSGGALPPSAVTAIATMLAFSHPLDPYQGLLEVKRACDAASLREFGWALFQEWMLADAPAKFDWALTGLGHFGDDEIARRLAPKIREWPGEGGHARAVKGLDVLANIGSDVALMHLDRIAQKLKFKGLQEKARAKMQEIAEARGLTTDELGDRIAPTLDLDDDGSKTFEVNGKKFRVGFDADLKPTLKNEDGKIVADLPKPGSPDWKALKKDSKTVAASQIFRLERAMCTKRTWNKEQFREFFVMHPLVSHLARRLVWRTASGKTFRVAEDRTYADADDKVFALEEDVTLPHRLALNDDEIARWSNVFAEYEILQPFPQLARETYAPEKKEGAATAIARFDKTKVPTGRVLHLEDRGWRRGVPQDAGWIWDMRKDLGGGVSAELALGGGILAGDMRESPAEQELGAITLTTKIEALDPIAFSELVRDVSLLSQ